MSAIYGFWRFDGAPVDPHDIDHMGATMAHRASDGRDCFIDGSIGLGHGLLRETREDAADAQPLYDRDAALVRVADARIDNRDSLADLLTIDPNTLATLPDSALILRAYRQWGEACAAHLLGDFAFALWDVRARKLMLGRDHMGQRYVHYHQGDGFFAFATEPKALLSLADVPRKLDDGTIARMLWMDLAPGNGETFFDGIRGIAGGTTLTIAADGSATPRRYWSIAPDPVHAGRTPDYYVQTYRRLLAEAVACRVHRAIAPPGLMLSGGFDSSAIAGLSRDALPAGMKLVTVSSALAPGSDHRFDARPKAQACQDAMPHLDHHWFVRTTETPFDDFESQCLANDRPPIASCHVLQGLSRRLAAQGCRVAMDGFGGDQTINPRRNRALAAVLARGRLVPFFKGVFGAARHRQQSVWTQFARVRRQIVPRPMRALWRQLRYQPAPWRRLAYAVPALTERMVRTGKLTPSSPLKADERQNEPAKDKMLLNIIQCWARPNLAIEMAAAGLVLTRPMLDKRIVEFGLAIPEHLHFSDGRARHLARLALSDVLPATLCAAPPGQEYFDPSFGDTVSDMIGEIAEALDGLGDHCTVRDYVELADLKQDLSLERLQDGQLVRPTRGIYALQIAKYIRWFEQQNH